MDRQEGYYWVKRFTHIKHEIAYYWPKLPNPWSLNGYTAHFTKSDFEHINEVRIKEPGELPEF